jgi:hypothetical protein
LNKIIVNTFTCVMDRVVQVKCIFYDNLQIGSRIFDSKVEIVYFCL